VKILITGSAGYIGSALAMSLVKEEHSVVSLDNLTRGNFKYLLNHYGKTSHLKLLIGDIRNFTDLRRVFESNREIDAIVHLAAIPGIERCKENPVDAIMTNVYGTYNVLETAIKYGISKIVFASSAAVYGDPIKTPIKEDHPLRPTNLYGVTKLAAEKLLYAYYKNYGLSTTILRLGNVYGVGLYTHWETVIPKFVRQALTQQPLTIYGNGSQSRDFVHVLDVVQAIKLVLEADKGIAGETFNIASGKPTSVISVADMVRKIIKERFNEKVKIVYLPPRKGEPYIKDFCLSIDKVKKRLGFKPRWTLEAGINQLVDFYLESGGA